MNHRASALIYEKTHYFIKKGDFTMVFVISKNGERLMPTKRLGKVRHLLKNGSAVIVKHNPFTIKLNYDTKSYVQPLELCMDTGYEHIGVSVKSKTTEYIGGQYDMLANEKQHHDDCRKYRRTRRNRLRYRKPRFDNRVSSKKEGWLAPSLKHKADLHIAIIESYLKIMPITDVYIEVGQFDTAVLAAVQAGKPIPEGVEYQHGPKYGINTLREAVFFRDNYTCRFCGKSAFKNNVILHVHHMLFWKNRHGNSLNELATCCDRCHTPANHQEGGLLWGKELQFKGVPEAAYMNSVKWYIYNKIKKLNVKVHITYGVATKEARSSLKLEKSHINDAYSMGNYHPDDRVKSMYYKKKRRNNRILTKFYDAKYIDSRTGKKVSGKDLYNGRIKRNHKLDSENLHKYRGQKISKGRVSTRTKRYFIQPGDTVLYQGKQYISKGCQNLGRYIKLDNSKVVSVENIKLIKISGGYEKFIPA